MGTLVPVALLASPIYFGIPEPHISLCVSICTLDSPRHPLQCVPASEFPSLKECMSITPQIDMWQWGGWLQNGCRIERQEKVQDGMARYRKQGTARSVEDNTRNAELIGYQNPEWWGDFSQLVKIEKIKFRGIWRYKVEWRLWLDLNSEVSGGTNSNWDFGLIWICSWLKSPHNSGFRLPLNSAFRVSSSTERAVS